jgi:hypothetical protein
MTTVRPALVRYLIQGVDGGVHRLHIPQLKQEHEAPGVRIID